MYQSPAPRSHTQFPLSSSSNMWYLREIWRICDCLLQVYTWCTFTCLTAWCHKMPTQENLKSFLLTAVTPSQKIPTSEQLSSHTIFYWFYQAGRYGSQDLRWLAIFISLCNSGFQKLTKLLKWINLLHCFYHRFHTMHGKVQIVLKQRLGWMQI